MTIALKSMENKENNVFNLKKHIIIYTEKHEVFSYTKITGFNCVINNLAHYQ